MLETVVQHDSVGEACLGDALQALQAVLTDEDRNPRKSAGQFQRLVSEYLWGTGPVDPVESLGLAPVAARQDGPTFPLSPVHELLEEDLEVRGFAGASDGHVAEDHRGQGALLLL